ncbi:MAG: glycosyltransferase family 2 protein [Saprospiraceae bacterium]
MKITVITPVYNGEATIGSCIDSVMSQSYADVEYIIMDAVSNDKTVSIVKAYTHENIKLISEKDLGLYDAINKGIENATGDIVCFLCADDMYTDRNVLKKIAEAFQTDATIDIIYADIIYVNRINTSKIDRYWKSSAFLPGLYRKGWLPPNTAFFIKKNSLLPHDKFNIRFKYAADYELNYRLLEKYRLKSVYLPEILVKMRSGGISNAGIKNIYKSLKDCYDVLLFHNVKHPFIYIVNTMFYRLKQIYIPSRIKNTTM